MGHLAYRDRLAALGLCWLATVGIVLGQVGPAKAALVQRYVTDDRANFVVFGNTTGLDCRDTGTEKPIVGDYPKGPLGLYNCRLLPDGTRGDDILWRSDEPQLGRALASALITPAAARSTAVLSLPAGAKVVYARLYWAGQVLPLLASGKSVVVERPGVFSVPASADMLRGSSTFPLGLLSYYQSTADITSLVQKYGSGAYRIGGIDTVDIISQQLDTLFIGWTAVVVYRLGTEPPRNLALFDGFDRVSSTGTNKTTLTVGGLTVPPSGTSAQLGIVAYAGNSDITGDALLVNGNPMSNMYNPADNFFNRTSTVLGALGPRTGDLPQFSGRPGSISGMDIDVVDISSALTSGATSFSVEANTTADQYFVGSIVTAVSTKRPLLGGTTKTVVNTSRSDGRYLPGDVLEYTISATNDGNDTATLVKVTDVLPTNVAYVPNSLKILTGPGMGNLTDATDNDQGEYNMNTSTITVRLGTGANGTTAGTLAAGASTSFRFQVSINNGAMGTVSNQAVIVTTPPGGTTPTSWPTGNGQNPNSPTVITISTCATNADCPASAPICDTNVNPHQCVCKTNSDCPNKQLCNPLTRQCVECLVGMLGNCDPTNIGGICLPSSLCGCATNTDCNGRTCDTATGICASVNTDLSLTLTRTPSGTIVEPGTPLTYVLTVTNKGGVPVTGAQLGTTIDPATQNATWTCTASGGAQCPAAMGSAANLVLPTVPAGGSLQFTYTTSAPPDQSSSAMDFTATLNPPRGFVDTNPADNTVTDSVLVGMLPRGPDLSINVLEDKSPNDPAVTYTIQVTNHGPGSADGATVTYQVPDNTTVDIVGGDGWSCAQQGSQVICTRTQPIAEGQTVDAKIVVHATGGQPSLPLVAQVTGTDPAGNPLSDPNPDDNKVNRTTNLDIFHLAGGGFACSVLPAASASGSLPASAGLLLIAAMGLARRRRAHARSSR